jgi:hypothetical protein
VSALKEITDKPVILDVHDSYLARSTPEEATEALDGGGMHVRVHTEERNNFQMADALVFPGEDFRDLVCGEFKLTQPALTLPSYVPSRFYEYATRDWHGGLVYEGKVSLPEEMKQPERRGFDYCDYTDMTERTQAKGMDFHLYATRGDEPFKKHYAKGADPPRPALRGADRQRIPARLGAGGEHRQASRMGSGDAEQALRLHGGWGSDRLDERSLLLEVPRGEPQTGYHGVGPEELGERWKRAPRREKARVQGAPGLGDGRPHPQAREVLRRGPCRC